MHGLDFLSNALWQPRVWVELVGRLSGLWRLAISALFASSVSATMQQENGPESQEFGYSWFGNSRQLERVGITWRVA